ncbi:MAG: hypothetical protein UT09_C0042G0006, partial [Parcubacteria group bacterium GW2011_GWF2_38_8]
HEITINGDYITHRLGSDIHKGDEFQLVISYGSWFAAEVEDKNSFAFVGCTVAPGFDFKDFEIANKTEMLREYPKIKSEILRLIK